MIEEHKPYREWNVPAALINSRATVTLLSEDELDELARQRWLERLGKDERLRKRWLEFLEKEGDDEHAEPPE